MLVADLAQALEIALRRRKNARGSGHGLDDHGGDGGGVVQRDDALQLVGEMRAPFRLAAGEGLFGAVIGVGQMVDARQQRAEELAVLDDAAHRDAAEADAVIAALAADQARLAALALHVPIGQRHLEGRIHGLGARVAEEDVVQVARGELGEARGEGEAARMAELERRRIVELLRLGLDGGRDLVPVMARIAAPQAGGAVDHLAAVRGVVVHALGAGDHPGVLLERAVRRERKPPGLQIVGCGKIVGGSGRLGSHGNPRYWLSVRTLAALSVVAKELFARCG